MVRYCCVHNCNNNKKKNPNLVFYNFPISWYKQDQRKKWINAVKLQNADGSVWKPNWNNTICCEHFIGNSKSDNQLSPSYVPTIFPVIYKKRHVHGSIENRHKRFMKRRFQETNTSLQFTAENPNIAVKENVLEDQTLNENANVFGKDLLHYLKSYNDQESQVNFLSYELDSSKTFICNRYVINGSCDAETRTEISECKQVIVSRKKNMSDKKCGTPRLTSCDASTQCNSGDVLPKDGFIGIKSINSNDQMLDLTGVTLKTFQMFNDKILPKKECTVKKENRLLIFFMKLKFGLTYSALSVLFQVHRTTISRIFIETLEYLSSALRNSIKWPDKDVIQGMMPQCFKPKYSNVRVIIDCTEFPVEVPRGVDITVFTYSHYKKGFTAKVLIGCSPNGLITFKSRCAGGRKSDTQITIESGLLDLVKDGDQILADKGLPQIKSKISESGKKVLLVMPPFLRNIEFSKEVEETYSVASVRIHIERIMQRIKMYYILNKIPAHLFNYIDDIIQVICTLVNLQPAIISEKDNND